MNFDLKESSMLNTPAFRSILNFARALGIAGCLAWSAQAGAQAFPAREVKIIVPQAPGGASDTLARLLGAELSKRWGQPVVVENKVGANGNIGTAEVARAPADGHTLLLTYAGTHATSPALYTSLPWDPVKDFVAVAPVGSLPFVMVVNSKLPVTDLKGLIELAKAQEGKLNNASPGAGSMNHLLGEMFNRAAGVKLTHVPYKGISQAMTDLLGGRVDVTFSSLQSVLPHVKSGALRALALTGAKRSPLMPDLPTMSELGLKDFDVQPWFGVLAPAATPPAVVARINRDITEITRSPEVVAKFAAVGATPLSMTPGEFDAQIKSDLAQWSRTVRAANIKLD
jgi:tripartite-type tricarboxylate transporter receptor subunit TctC